ncbi:MAG TPA: ribbon-helix-helix protein, CopG family [Terriglobia bacterium]|nr:ribbon-helix-helix protein, CopG family [Terriglobia bacterium]
MPASVRLGTRLEKRLEKLARRTGRPKSVYIRRAIEEYLDEQEDYLVALQRLEENLPAVPLDEVLSRLNLRNRSKARGRG